ncbi:hypothetical protein M0805_002569 [Coniferiporia weirii]|nr:hypothetical protein M0805_002569 [Coniferiporia weirii]
MSDTSHFAVPLEDKYSPFHISTHAYKLIDGHPILVDVFVPRKLMNEEPNSASWSEKRPVIVRIHGGWLVGGQRDFAPWCPAWLLELALKHNAIFVAPDYRLLPEAKGEDILDDLDDFWKWLARGLPDAVHASCAGLKIDLDRVLVGGESAGGYLSVQVGLSSLDLASKESESQPSTQTLPSPRVRALVCAYPVLSLRAPYWTKDYHKQIFDNPQYPNSLIDERLASVKNATTRSVVSNADLVGTPRGQFAIALVQRGRLLEVLGEDSDLTPGKRRLHPEDRVEDGSKLPPTFFIHGIDDSAVPYGVTDRFVELLKKHKAVDGMEGGNEDGEVLQFAKVPGEHGFDNSIRLDSTDWVKDVASFVKKHWLK